MRPSGPRSRPTWRVWPGAPGRVLAALPILGWIAWILPGSVLADTGSPPPIVPSVEDPVGDLASTLLTIGTIVVTLVGVIGGIALAVAIVARLGGGAGPGARGSASLLPRSAIGWVALGAFLVPVAALGILTGRGMAYYSSVGGFTAITAGVMGMALVLAAVLLAIIAGLARRRRKAMSPAIASLLLAAGLLPIGAAAGAGTAALTGGTHRDPVFLEASGSVSIELTTPDLDFTPMAQGTGPCRSVADGTDVEGFTALDLGELTIDGASGTLRGEVGLRSRDSKRADISFWIDGGDLTEGSFQPFWEGSGVLVEVSQTGATGTVQFSALPVMALKEDPVPMSSWPATLSGSIEWSCGAW